MDSQTLNNLLAKNQADINQIAMEILESKFDSASPDDLFDFKSLVQEEVEQKKKGKEEGSNKRGSGQQNQNSTKENKNIKEGDLKKVAESLVAIISSKVAKGESSSKIADILVSLIVDKMGNIKEDIKTDSKMVFPHFLIDNPHNDPKKENTTEEKVEGYNLNMDKFDLYCPFNCPFKDSCPNYRSGRK